MPLLSQYVNSSMISYIEYDEEDFTLFVEFKSGVEFKYENVSKETYNDLICASSVGRYFAKNIKDNYEYEEL